MTSDPTAVTLESRLEALEKDNRRLRRQMRGSLIVLSVATIALLMGAFRAEQAVEVMDGAGKLRAVLFADNGQNRSGLEIFDSRGKPRFRLRTNRPNEDPVFEIFDAKDRLRIDMGIGSNGEAFLSLFDGNGQRRHGFVVPE